MEQISGRRMVPLIPKVINGPVQTGGPLMLLPSVPVQAGDGPEPPRRVRRAKLEPEPFLQSLAVYRYLRAE